ncbi:unannotated protein [freshwater metagenome]|uniref:Unannotated protein n=1 Tax=freshwater metagenome TaxID=449393 RepID=A0A6J7NQR7_9ZZZZ
MLFDDVFEDVPHLGAATFDHALGRLDVLRQLLVDEALHDEGLEQLEGHELRQTALVQLERGADDDDRTTGVVDALAEQVLAEPALLALQHVGQRLERAIARPGDRAAAATIVEECVDSFLQHALFVVDDDRWRAEIEQSLEPVVAIDHATVEVVEIAGGEATTVELHHGAQFGRDDRDDVEDHGARVVDPAAVLVAAVERGDDLQPLDRLLLALRRQRTLAFLRIDLGPQLDLFDVEINAADEPGDGLGAHATLEVVAEAGDELAPQHLVFDDLTGEQALELVERATEHIDFLIEALADGHEITLGRSLAGLDLGVLGAVLLELDEFLLEIFLTAGELKLAVLLDGLALERNFLLEVGEVLVALLVVDPGHDVRREVDDLLELLGLQLLAGLGAHEQVGEPGTRASEVPDMHDGGRELDVAHALAPDLRARDFDAAALADDALEAHALVLAAVALPVLRRTEDLLAEQPVFLGLQRAVVDGFWLLHLTVRPHADGVRRGQTDADLVEVIYIKHEFPRVACAASSGVVGVGGRSSPPALCRAAVVFFVRAALVAR